jgi:hypothetical protein
LAGLNHPNIAGLIYWRDAPELVPDPPEPSTFQKAALSCADRVREQAALSARALTSEGASDRTGFQARRCWRSGSLGAENRTSVDERDPNGGYCLPGTVGTTIPGPLAKADREIRFPRDPEEISRLLKNAARPRTRSRGTLEPLSRKQRCSGTQNYNSLL